MPVWFCNWLLETTMKIIGATSYRVTYNKIRRGKKCIGEV